jgi:shikimate dehydrogenase
MIRAAVLGAPIEHSLSPVIHQRAYEILGWNWRYERHEVHAGQLEKFLENNRGYFRGLSLTMPLKEEALRVIDSISDLGKRVNGVNTLIFDELHVRGENTDVQGFIDALKFHQILVPKVVTILGGGATARAAIAAVDGISERINVFSRSAHRAKALVNSATKSIVNIYEWRELAESHRAIENADSFGMKAELVIATTPIGATDQLQITGTSQTLFESLYHPWPTALLRNWRDSGGFGLDGLDLLIWQAIGQLELMNLSDGKVQERRTELYHEMRSSALSILAQ